MKACDYCGRENEDGVEFCSECGTPEFKKLNVERCRPEPKRPMMTRERWSYGWCTMVLLGAMILNIAGHDGIGTPVAILALSFLFGMAEDNGRLTTLKGQKKGSDAHHAC